MKNWIILLGYVLALTEAITLETEPKLLNISDVAIAICSVQPTWTVVHDHEDCTKFYVCANHDVKLFNCKQGFHFSNVSMRCEIGGCTVQNQDQNGNQHAPEIARHKCRPESVRRATDDCTSYELCFEGAYKQARCSIGYYFDVGVGVCLPIDVTARHQCSCLLPEHATLSNPDDCETYFVCEKGKAVLQQCPHGKYYNEQRGACLVDQTGICLEALTKPPILGIEQQAQRECRETGSLLAPHATNCSKYFVCGVDQIFEMNCPSGKYFDPVWRYCHKDEGNACGAKFSVISAANTNDNIDLVPIASKKSIKVLVMDGNDKLVEVSLLNHELKELMKIVNKIERINTEQDETEITTSELREMEAENTKSHNSTRPTRMQFKKLYSKLRML